MAEPREREVILTGTVCEDANSYQDESVRTADQARAKGKQRCPLFDECVYGDMLNKKRIRCAARAGDFVGKYATEDGTSVETEMADFREEAFSPRNPIGTFGFIDPYDDPEKVVTDPVEGAEMVENWANIVVHGAAEGSEASV